MAVRIKSIRGDSGTFKTGDEIVSIDGAPVTDQLDLLFLTEREGSADFSIRRPGRRMIRRRLRMDTFRSAGLVFEEMQFIRCSSRCIFCFVDQMPRGLRKSLYIKDDDYRLSFLYGNYVTLNDIEAKDIRRIIELNLSPVYISVHAVDRKTRERLFGRRIRTGILDLMAELARAGITMHVQVVLVPGINDGKELEKTVDNLFAFYPYCRSLAVVPIGLTSHRKGLTPLRSVSRDESRALIRWTEKRCAGFRKRTGGNSFLYLSDEFYLKAGRLLPASVSYDDFPQIANGVGMCRLFIDRIIRELELLKNRKVRPTSIGLVTGTLGKRFLGRYIVPLVSSRLPEVRIHLVVVRNRLFGKPVGVSGLLAGRDIARAAVGAVGTIRCLVIPPNALNHDGLLIDGLSVKNLEQELGMPVIVPGQTFLEKRVLAACGGAKR